MKETTKEILSELIARYPALSEEQRSIAAAFELLLSSAENGGKIMICGNGGSAADSAHIVGELMKSFKKPARIVMYYAARETAKFFALR